jgi:transcriptional regulator with XRE-family HTH domain
VTNPGGEAIRRLAAAELARRREGNPRYSLRAFAASVGVDHGTLSRLLRGVRTPRRDVAARLTAALQSDRDTTALVRLIESGAASGVAESGWKEIDG